MQLRFLRFHRLVTFIVVFLFRRLYFEKFRFVRKLAILARFNNLLNLFLSFSIERLFFAEFAEIPGGASAAPRAPDLLVHIGKDL